MKDAVSLLITCVCRVNTIEDTKSEVSYQHMVCDLIKENCF